VAELQHPQGTKHGEENHIINTTKQKELGGTKDITTKLDEWRTPKRNIWGSLNKNRVFRNIL
jgi:hypothetical protein